MAGENRASYAKIGLAITAGVVAVVFSLIYFGGIRTGGGEILAETYSDEVVTGLSVGSDVNFRGVKIGEVKKISFIGSEYDVDDDADRTKVYILMGLNPKLLNTKNGESPDTMLLWHIDKGLRAIVTSSGITGLSKIQLDYPKSAPQPARITWHPSYPCIPPSPSMFASFSDSAIRVMDQLNDMDFRQLWTNVTGIAESVNTMSDSVNALIDAQRGSVAQIVGNLEAASESLRRFSEEIRDNPSLLLRPNDPEPLPETAR